MISLNINWIYLLLCYTELERKRQNSRDYSYKHFMNVSLQVNIVDPLKLTAEFSNILADHIIATNVVATFIIHKGL